MRYETTGRLVILTTFFIFASTAYGYDTPTHSSISYWAIHRNQSTINQFLEDDLLWKSGIERQPAFRPQIDGECTKGCSLSQWLERGAVKEDDDPRYLYHFYNPLKAVGGNGLTDPGLSTIPFDPPLTDSLTWMWNGGDEDATQYIIGQEDARLTNGGGFNVAPEKTPKNLWSWKMARYYYFRSLVGFISDGSKLPLGSYDQSENVYPRTRASAEAKTFYALGHVIHLLQDLAQPQHTRNDAHTLNEGSPMEKYCKLNFGNDDQIKEFAEQESIPKFSYLFQIPPQGIDGMPKELKSFWDTDQYDGRANWRHDNKTSPLGLAEYSNAYFVTDDTLPANGLLPQNVRAQILNPPKPFHVFPYPTFANTDLKVFPEITSNVTVALKGQVRNITAVKPKSLPQKCGDVAEYNFNGEIIPNLFSYSAQSFYTTGVFGSDRVEYDIRLCDANYDAQARKLLPKAVSYSAGLLEYFFRGRLEVTATPIENDETQVDPQLGEECLLTVKNLTTTQESLKGIDYLRALGETVWATTTEELLKDAAVRAKEVGRELRKNRAEWVLLEDELEGDARGKMYDRGIVGYDFFQNERNPEGFDGELKYKETFTTKVRLKRGHTYTLVFRGTIGNETQNAVAATRFAF